MATSMRMASGLLSFGQGFTANFAQAPRWASLGDSSNCGYTRMISRLSGHRSCHTQNRECAASTANSLACSRVLGQLPPLRAGLPCTLETIA